MYKFSLISLLILSILILSILEHKPLLSLAPSSQINNMFKADTHSAQMTILKRFGSLIAPLGLGTFKKENAADSYSTQMFILKQFEKLIAPLGLKTFELDDAQNLIKLFNNLDLRYRHKANAFATIGTLLEYKQTPLNINIFYLLLIKALATQTKKVMLTQNTFNNKYQWLLFFYFLHTVYKINDFYLDQTYYDILNILLLSYSEQPENKNLSHLSQIDHILHFFHIDILFPKKSLLTRQILAVRSINPKYLSCNPDKKLWLLKTDASPKHQEWTQYFKDKLQEKGFKVTGTCDILEMLSQAITKNEPLPLDTETFHILLSEALFAMMQIQTQKEDYLQDIIANQKMWLEILSNVYRIYLIHNFSMSKFENIIAIWLSNIFQKNKHCRLSSKENNSLQDYPETILSTDTLYVVLFKMHECNKYLFAKNKDRAIANRRQKALRQILKVSLHESSDFLAKQVKDNTYLTMFKEKLAEYHPEPLDDKALENKQVNQQALVIFDKLLAPLLKDKLSVNLDLSLFISMADQAIAPIVIHSLKQTNSHNYQTFLDLAPCYFNTTSNTSLLEDFVDQIIFLLALPKAPIATHALIEMLTDCLFALHKHYALIHNANIIIDKITAFLQQSPFVSYAIPHLVNKYSSFVSLDFVVRQLTSNPQHILANEQLKAPFRVIIQELNSMSNYRLANTLIDTYQQLVILTQDNSSWRDILQQETSSLKESYTELYFQLQDLYEQHPLKPTKAPETLTLTTLVQALKDNKPDAMAIVNNPANALEVVELIQNLIHSQNKSVFLQLDYKPLYASIVSFLAQNPATLLQLLASINIYLSKPKHQKSADITLIKDPHKIIHTTLDLIDHVVNSHPNADLQIIWLEWLHSHAHSSLVHQRLIKSIFRWSPDQDIPDKYYVLFEKWWTNASFVKRSHILGLKDVGLLQSAKNASPEDIKKTCWLWELQMQQFVNIFYRPQKKSLQFSSLSDDFIDLWCKQLRQWINFLATLDNPQENFVYTSHPYIPILQILEMFYQDIDSVYISTNSHQKLSEILKDIDKRINGIIQQYIQEKCISLFHLSQGTQPLINLQKIQFKQLKYQQRQEIIHQQIVEFIQIEKLLCKQKLELEQIPKVTQELEVMQGQKTKQLQTLRREIQETLKQEQKLKTAINKKQNLSQKRKKRRYIVKKLLQEKEEERNLSQKLEVMQIQKTKQLLLQKKMQAYGIELTQRLEVMQIQKIRQMQGLIQMQQILEETGNDNPGKYSYRSRFDREYSASATKQLS